MRSALNVRDRLRLPTPSLRRAARKARTSRAESAKSCFMSGSLSCARGDEGEELADVALVDFGRVRRELALDRKIGEPVLDRLAQVRRALNPLRFRRFSQSRDPQIAL